MSKYRIEFTEHENGVPIRFAITFQSESKEKAEAEFWYRHPRAWDAVTLEVDGIRSVELIIPTHPTPSTHIQSGKQPQG